MTLIQTLTESALRKRAQRRGYHLSKSRASWSLDNLGGFQIVDRDHGILLAGDKFELTLEDVAAWLTEADEAHEARVAAARVLPPIPASWYQVPDVSRG